MWSINSSVTNFAISLVGAEKQRKSLNHLFLLSLPCLSSLLPIPFTVFNHHPTLTSIILLFIFIYLYGDTYVSHPSTLSLLSPIYVGFLIFLHMLSLPCLRYCVMLRNDWCSGWVSPIVVKNNNYYYRYY